MFFFFSKDSQHLSENAENSFLSSTLTLTRSFEMDKMGYIEGGKAMEPILLGRVYLMCSCGVHALDACILLQ